AIDAAVVTLSSADGRRQPVTGSGVAWVEVNRISQSAVTLYRMAAFCSPAHHSLKSPPWSCVSITLPRVGNRYHFLRNAAAIFSIIHRSPTQISHNALRNP